MVAALAVLTFVPIKFLHPLRVKRLRALNVALLAVWAVLAFIAVIVQSRAGTLSSCGRWSRIALYFFVAGLLRTPA